MCAFINVFYSRPFPSLEGITVSVLHIGKLRLRERDFRMIYECHTAMAEWQHPDQDMGSEQAA